DRGERAAPPATGPGPGPEVPGYEILGELGKGGMGVVYKARQVRAGRLVALKMLRHRDADPEELARFRTEAEAGARLAHPTIVQVDEVGEHEGRPFFSLEFRPGGSLDRKLAGTPPAAGRGRPTGPGAGRGRAGGARARRRPPRPQAGQRPAGRRRHAPRHR